MIKYFFNSFLLSLLFTIPVSIFAQQENGIKGEVFGINTNGETKALIGANIVWLNTLNGAITDINGKFSIAPSSNSKSLVFSYTGYKSDTIQIESNEYLVVSLAESVELDAVEVISRKKTSEVSYLDPHYSLNINEEELNKAACCNLSESFETNPTVDVSFTDAITGTRQIQMLGLAGPYSQITRENMPDIRGLSAVYGLNFVPGPWIESVQLIKGTGSVVNGFESIAGQINVCLKSPDNMERIYLNVFGNEEGRMETNLNLLKPIGDNWKTALLLHGNSSRLEHDRNSDNFIDMPVGEQFIAINRWKYTGKKNIRFQLGSKYIFVDKYGGQIGSNPISINNLWGMVNNINRVEGWMKLGKVWEDKPYQSIGFQASGVSHNQNTYFGNNKYLANQQSLYGNIIFQSILGNTNHKYKAGLSVQSDIYDEKLNAGNYSRDEIVSGTFWEYTYTNTEKFNAVAGLRADHHNFFGTFITPRLHIRYAPWERTVFRASGGRGYRNASVISENMGLLASSRNIIFEKSNNYGFGLSPEIAWNYGISLNQRFRLNYREGAISIDFFRTDFKNQIVVNLERDPQSVFFSNLQGESYSNSFQSQIDYEIINRLDVRLAYRYYEVKTTYDNELLLKPFTSQNRAFLNLAYETRNHLKFDYTLNWQGKKRIPDLSANPAEYQMPNFSPSFIMMNAQISKLWNEKFEIYIGAENLLNFKQEDPIIASNDAFGPYFDSSMIWGPIFGRNIYGGIRYKLK